MLTTLYYCFQVILCSTIMMGYYWLVLRDKKFHQYNRFYLLTVSVLSWLVPLIKIQWQQPVEADSTVYYLLSSVASNNSDIDLTLQSKWYNLNWQASLTVVYATVSLLLLIGMITALIRIYRLLKNNACKTLGEVFVILTNAKGTPFSFFSYIFWNDAIDLKSDSGKQILQHELTHVKQKHSIDKILIQLVLIIGWFNPLFWLIKKEMDMIHEFIADQHTVENGDAATLAEMLLTAVYPQQKYLLANPFFFSPIKRRIQMIKNNSTPKYSYMRRLIILPLLAIVVVLFAFRSKKMQNEKSISVASVIENIATPMKENFSGSHVDTTILHSDSIYVIPKEKSVRIIKNSSDKTITIIGNGDHMRFSEDDTKPSMLLKSFPNGAKPIIKLDGKIIDEKELNTISPNDITSINVVKGKVAEEQYGAEAKNGIMIISTKKGDGKLIKGQRMIIDSVIINKDGKRLDKETVIINGNKVDLNDFDLNLNGNSNIKIIKREGKNRISEDGKDREIEIITESGADKMINVEKNSKSSSAIKALKEKNPDIQSVIWVHSPLRMVIRFKDGSVESYDLTNQESLGRAEKRYGKLPVPPPPPPPSPIEKRSSKKQSENN